MQTWIEQLGSERFADRESATKHLTSLPTPPVEMLRVAAKDVDPEVRYRARWILGLDESYRRAKLEAKVMVAMVGWLDDLSAWIVWWLMGWMCGCRFDC